MNTLYLTKALWSADYSHTLTGYGENDEFVMTDRLYVTDKEDVYRTAEGREVQVVSWAPDGRGYGDRKGEK